MGTDETGTREHSNANIYNHYYHYYILLLLLLLFIVDFFWDTLYVDDWYVKTTETYLIFVKTNRQLQFLRPKNMQIMYFVIFAILQQMYE